MTWSERTPVGTGPCGYRVDPGTQFTRPVRRPSATSCVRPPRPSFAVSSHSLSLGSSEKKGDVVREIRVVGAAIVEGGLVLCAQRGPTGSLAGLWEFPGGKIEDNESAASALEREIREELDCLVRVGQEITTTSHEYDFGIVTLTTFYCTLLSGTPRTSEHAAIAWLAPKDLLTLEWAPADIHAVAKIQTDFA